MPETPLDYEQSLDEVAGVNRLQEYLRDRAAELGLSDAEVARRARMDKQRYSDILNGRRKGIPPVEILDQLAVALQVPRSVVRRIAAEQFGYSVSTADLSEDDVTFVATLRELPEHRRRDLMRLAELYLSESKQNEEGRRRRGDKGP